MRCGSATWTAAVLLCLPALVQAQLAERNTTVRDGRKARIDAREVRGTTQLMQAAPPADKTQEESGPIVTFALGLAYDKDEAGTRTHSTPVALAYQTIGDRWWKFKIEGDGYARSKEKGARTVDGLADVSLKMQHALGGGFTGGVGLSLPTKGEVGSTTATQSAKLIYETPSESGRWGAMASGSLLHENGAPQDKSPYSKVLYGELNYQIKDRHLLLANATYTRRSGEPSSTDLGVEYDFPLSSVSRLKPIDGSLSLVRGITNGSRHTTVEFDVSWRF